MLRMWESPDEARSDFFLAGAVYVIGPVIIGLLVDLLPASAVVFVDRWLSPVIAFATTGLVPLLLARYRKQGASYFGFGRGFGGVAQGLLLAAPLVAATVLAALAQPQRDLVTAVPATALLGRQGLDALLTTVTQVAFWGGLSWLLIFATSKARAAFRPFTGSLRGIAVQVGRIVAAVAALAFIALLLSRSGPLANTALDGRSTFASILALALPALAVAAHGAAGPAPRARPLDHRPLDDRGSGRPGGRGAVPPHAER